MKRATARAKAAPVVRQPARWRAEGPEKPFTVETRKTAGTWVTFARYETRGEAQAVAARLSELGAPTRVVAAG